MGLTSHATHATVLVLTAFRAPGCTPAAEERVQGGPGEDACKSPCDLSRNVKTLIKIRENLRPSEAAKLNQVK